MVKVLHIAKGYPPSVGGMETLARDLCLALKKEGYEQKVLAFSDTPKTSFESLDGIDVVRVGVWKKIASQPIAFSYRKQLAKILKEWKPDVIAFQYPNPYSASILLQEMRRYHFQGKFLLQWTYDIVKQKALAWAFDHQNKTLLRKADVVMIITPTYTKDTSYLPYFKKDYCVVPCRIGDSRLAVTPEEIQRSAQIKKEHEGKKICFFFGRHVEYKGLHYLIDSDRFLDQKRVDIIVGGSGPLTAKLKEEAVSYPNISFVGRLSEEEINAYLLACDIFAFPSITRNEAFGISLAEAMHFGKPAVTFTIKGSGVNWVCPNGMAGLEAPNRDSEALAKNITRLMDDPKLYQTLAENAKKRCDDLFSITAFETNVSNLYKELLKKEPTSHE
jgi:glycosyltransferase involved in cell wall biosynthesis